MLKYRKLFNSQTIENGWFFYCDDTIRMDIRLKILENKYLPKYVQNNLLKFKHLMYPKKEEEQLELIKQL